MNFRTTQSADNKIILVDRFGNKEETLYNNISYYGDNYVIAKQNDSIFYTILNLDGEVILQELNIIHRFNNGFLLTYSSFYKEYRSSDNFTYTVNYNKYAVYNHTTKTSRVISIIQSDRIADTTITNPLLKIETIEYFINKPIYSFNDFIFSEIIDDQYIITGDHFDLLSKKSKQQSKSSLFENYKGKKIWSILNVFDHKIQTEDMTSLSDDDTLLSRCSFRDVEYSLFSLMTFNETVTHTQQEQVSAPVATKQISNPEATTQAVQPKTQNRIGKNRQRLQNMFSGILAFSNN